MENKELEALNNTSGEELEYLKKKYEIINLKQEISSKRRWFFNSSLMLVIFSGLTILINWYLNKDYVRQEFEKKELENEVADLKLQKESLKIEKQRNNLNTEKQKLDYSINQLKKDSIELIRREEKIGQKEDEILIRMKDIAMKENDIRELEENLKTEEKRLDSMRTTYNALSEKYLSDINYLRKKNDSINSLLENAEFKLDVYSGIQDYNRLENKINYLEETLLTKTYEDGYKEVIDIFQALKSIQCMPDYEDAVGNENWVNDCWELKQSLIELEEKWKSDGMIRDKEIVEKNCALISNRLARLINYIETEWIDESE